MKKILVPIFSLFLFGCNDDAQPKPKAFLRLDYPEANYKLTDIEAPFSFEKNEFSKSVIDTKSIKEDGAYNVNLEYPSLKGTVYLSYKKVTKTNLKDLLRDAQNLTQNHTLKADEIEGNVFVNPNKSVYGMFYEVGGNAASQSQFYVTDSTKHFLSGSLYFNAIPNYDSIYPAVIYLKKDIRRVMESLEWKN